MRPTGNFLPVPVPDGTRILLSALAAPPCRRDKKTPLFHPAGSGAFVSIFIGPSISAAGTAQRETALDIGSVVERIPPVGRLSLLHRRPFGGPALLSGHGSRATRNRSKQERNDHQENHRSFHIDSSVGIGVLDQGCFYHKHGGISLSRPSDRKSNSSGGDKHMVIYHRVCRPSCISNMAEAREVPMSGQFAPGGCL